MAPEKSPAFQFYPKDFLSDENQSAMTLPEVGAYARLMSRCWLEGSLPEELAKLGRLCGATAFQMKQLWPAIQVCFRHREDGRWIHPRLEKEREKQAKFSRRQTDAVEARWKKKRQYQNNTTVLPNAYSAVSDLQSPSSSPKERELVPDTGEARDAEWLQFQAAYPGTRRSAGFMESQGFLEACADIGFPALMALLEKQKKSKDWREGFAPGMEKYFRLKLWIQNPDEALVPAHRPASFAPPTTLPGWTCPQCQHHNPTKLRACVCGTARP